MGLSVELQPRDGGFVKLGTQQDGGYGVLPGSIEFDGDLSEYGCLSASFRLKLNPRWPRNIIEHYTPVVISDGSDHRWSGRIIAAPTTYTDDAEVVIQCQGWGQHTKDDCTDREWVIADMSRLVESRSLTAAQLSKYPAAAQYSTNGNGRVMAGMGRAQYLENDRLVGSWTLDLGANNLATGAYVYYESSNNWGASATVALRLSNTADAYAAGNTTYSTTSPGTGPTLLGGTGATPSRYVHIWLYWNGGAVASLAADVFIAFRDLIIATDGSDLSGGASVLKASTVISETLDAICPLISSDRSKISTTSLSLPQFPGSPGYKYANELIDQANAYHGNLFRLSPDPVPVPEFAAMPTDYTFVVGGGEYTLLEPAALDGREVYSRVISEYEDAAGVRGIATASIANTNVQIKLASAQPSNPSFDTNTTGWSTTYGTINRDTGVFNSGPASGRMTPAGADVTIYTESWSGSLTPGRTYRAFLWYKLGAGAPQYKLAVSTTGTTGTSAGLPGYIASVGMPDTSGNWAVAQVDFIADASTVRFTVDSPAASAVDSYIDTISVYELTSTIVERRGFVRTALKPPVGRSTTAAATALAQLELNNAQFPPFKGTIGITGRIRTKGGASMHVSCLPSMVGEAILIENLHDQNTGALGRQGIIQTAKYVEAEDRAEITIDSASNFLKTLRSRIALFTAAA